MLEGADEIVAEKIHRYLSVAIRNYVVEHGDTEIAGPTMAAEWLKKLE